MRGTFVRVLKIPPREYRKRFAMSKKAAPSSHAVLRLRMLSAFGSPTHPPQTELRAVHAVLAVFLGYMSLLRKGESLEV
jgi:hypothetical protein